LLARLFPGAEAWVRGYRHMRILKMKEASYNS
jgi:hypothetical protein